jgi:omega-6 fatty acid desaturase (delta-12 desaturase)
MRGFREVLVLYVIPYLQVNHWLVAITFLQHTDPLLPHYSAAKWTFARGALCTIDRQFLGPIGGIVLHGICETHVAHHISSKIPHYAAWEATEAIKNYVGEYYMKSDENFLVSLFKNYRECRWVEDKGDILFYRNGKGIAQRVGVDENGGVSDSGVDVSADKI